MWEIIPDTNDKYEVSDDGRVRNRNTKRELTQQPNNKGYMRVWLFVNGKQKARFVHRLVAFAFCLRPKDPRYSQVNHKNEDKSDNRAQNLEWVMPRENVNYGTGKARRALSQSLPVLMSVGSVCVGFKSAHEAEERTGIPAKSIQKCCTGKLKSTHGATFKYQKVVE